MYESKTTAQFYALAVGLVLLALGVAGFIVLGFENKVVGPWNSTAYTLGGLLGLATWRRADSARAYAIGVGLFYGLLAGWGFLAFAGVVGYPYLGLLSHTLAGAIFHAVLGVASFIIGFTSPRHGRYPVPDIAALA